MDLVLDIWREACRHIEIAESIDLMARRIGLDIPGDLLLIRRIDPDRLLIETAGTGRLRDLARLPDWPGRAEFPSRTFHTVMAWSREARVRSGAAGSADPILAALVPAGATGSAMVGPLRHESGLLGAVVVTSTIASFSAAHEATFERLLEPLGVALANHHRLHDMERMRAALEADKHALLSRLGRPGVVDEIVGADAGLREVMERVDQVAQTDVPVLLIGETGTGKEVVARAVHARSRRATAPVVRVNCGAIPTGLIDSELFGHERGSFTGAVGQRQGWFERADGGTLFLDEIGELPLDAQVRLLRILQDGTFERVGGERSLTVDVRIVAATHRDLAEMVADRTFREDLWYRIGVFPIRLPTLRERPGDIALLATHFASRAGLRLGGHELAISEADLALLRTHRWPGNVRELGAVIERAAILGGGRELRIAAALGVSSDVSARKFGGLLPIATEAHPGDRHGVPAIERYDDAQRAHIAATVLRAGGRIDGPRGAAAILRVNPHTLRARMRRLGITPASLRTHAARTTASEGRGSSHDDARPPTDAAAASLDAAMRRHLASALTACAGRIEGPTGAARLLDVNPHTLRARMRRLGVEWAEFRLGGR